ncbi:hypothetical protein FGG08_002615 [Glutinoglossum americanum]|uniref:DRBM domain-containing protein n=1 Tax=Glutinoglossum americanum TaxID=1670608 RepID=A0A9P8IES6_9PEZI|nr:hypothetical protein FGG08_002615 [Glutinoglossum americanum]
MADLLQSLLTTRPDNPQHRAEAGMYSSSSDARQLNPQQVPGGSLDASEDAADMNHALVDADEFLRNLTPARYEDGPAGVIPALQPVKIGQSRSSVNSVAFHRLAQEKGVTPVFVFKELVPQQFSAKLTLSGQVDIEDAGSWPSKKAAKEAVCEKGIQALMGMEGRVAIPPSSDENWVGKLQNFAMGTQFACELKIDQRPSAPFGGRHVTFLNKKAAKANAAHEALEWLIENGYMGREGPPSKRKRKGGSSGTAAIGPGATVEIKRDARFAQKVNVDDGDLKELCPLIGLSPPEYRITPDPRADSMYSGAAYFNDPILPSGPIGEIRNVFGKKIAKEEISKSVLAYLKEWAKKRGVELRESE